MLVTQLTINLSMFQRKGAIAQHDCIMMGMGRRSKPLKDVRHADIRKWAPRRVVSNDVSWSLDVSPYRNRWHSLHSWRFLSPGFAPSCCELWQTWFLLLPCLVVRGFSFVYSFCMFLCMWVLCTCMWSVLFYPFGLVLVFLQTAKRRSSIALRFQPNYLVSPPFATGTCSIPSSCIDLIDVMPIIHIHCDDWNVKKCQCFTFVSTKRIKVYLFIIILLRFTILF